VKDPLRPNTLHNLLLIGVPAYRVYRRMKRRNIKVKALVTGAADFTGSHLFDMLLELGDKIRALV